MKTRNTTLCILLDLDHSCNVPLYKQAIQSLRKKILERHFVEHELLPAVKKMANYNSVGWITIDRAYRQLEKDGFLTRLRGVGYYVCSRESTKKRALLLIDHPVDYIQSSYFQQIKAICGRILVEYKFFYNDPVLLKEIVKSTNNYHYLIFYSNPSRVRDVSTYLNILAGIPQEKLIVLDERDPDIEPLFCNLQSDSVCAV